MRVGRLTMRRDEGWKAKIIRSPFTQKHGLTKERREYPATVFVYAVVVDD